ncbi:Heavy-metal-associated domain (N-terminus) and membrane-bounded cytochrome biogenesis cycZ-like domain, possible membrane copper tolerance protein [hydrothermal vent metagenome]|uniref:Heavy-metal-associated domain (N-terminus) and membrane-bounded cytochrome biogenesis cycZ-like domain, possible membrane copper tolerance protein n=1 Tax=hydrothermal vent metagenome TaxID=652676 RepID=A0A3B1AV71_9ZZZZ
MPYASALVVGLLGGIHCVGMCGGIVSALTFGLSAQKQGRILSVLPFQVAYNLGRITSYTLAGAIMGGLGILLAELLPVYLAQRVLLGFAGLFMILLGLYLAGWWMFLSRVELAGNLLWKSIEPIGKRLLPVDSPGQALKIGLVWGWFPCGLVYSMLVTAIAAGGALQGAGVMLAFGLGTLPNLMLMGVLAGAVAKMTRSPFIRQIAGGMVILFGIFTLWRVY